MSMCERFYTENLNQMNKRCHCGWSCSNQILVHLVTFALAFIFHFMATARTQDLPSQKDVENPVQLNDSDRKQCQESVDNAFNYAQRAQWLRAAVLGANDGLVSVASLMMGVGAVKKDIKVMLLAGFAGLIAGACSMAIGEFVSVYTQLDIEVAQLKRNRRNGDHNDEEDTEKEQLPNPLQAAFASALAFAVGAVVPLLGAAFIREHEVRLAVVAAVSSLALAGFGGLGAVLGGTPVAKSSARVLIGGWMAMAITFGLTKLIGIGGLEM